MKKKNMKPIVLSALLALSFGAVSVGTTFALFTDVAEANVAVKAGEVKVTNEIQILEAKSLNDHAETVTGGTDVTYINGGTANVDNTTGKVTISRWTPGDSVTLQTTPVNGSNVKTKMRLRVVMSGDLAPALKVTGIKNNTNAFVISGKKTYCTAWTLTEAGANPDAYDVKIEFPDSDNGEILFGSENKDNKYQGKEAEIHIYYEAVQGNAAIDDLLERVNSRLAEEEIIDGKANDTMHEAFADLEDLLTPADAKSNHFVWNYETDAFARETAVTADQYKYFKVADDYVTDFSMYASEAWTHTDVALTGLGFDVGAHTDIASITYTGAAEARENIIRTNSLNTTLTIDDSSTGTIRHYGFAGELNIIQCHTASCHEYGTVAFAEIAKGRIVLESGSEIKHIHVDKKDNASFDTVIIADNGAKALPEKITRDEVTVTTETLVVTVESNGSSEKVYVYADGTTGTTEKTTTQNTEVESALGQLVLDNGEDSKALSPEAKTEAQKEAVVEAANIEIALDPTSLTLQKDGTAKIIATVNTSANYNYILSWTSSNPAVATVDENGNVTGVADGSATITATAGNKTATCTVTVTSGIAITKSSLTDGKKEINQGGSYYLAETIEGQLIITGDITVTLDLNGFTIGITQTTTQAGTANHAKDVVYVKDGATVTIKDSSEGPTGKILNTFNGANPGYAYALCIEDSTVTLESGTIEYSSSGNSGSNMAVGVGHMPFIVIAGTYKNLAGTDIGEEEAFGLLETATNSNESSYGKFIIDGGKIRGANSDAVFAQFATVEVKNPYAFGTGDRIINAFGGTITYPKDKFTESSEDGFLTAYVRGAN